MAEALETFSQSPLYLLWMIFLGAFPIVTAMLSVDSSRRFTLDRDEEGNGVLPGPEDLAEARRRFPVLTVVIPARNEQELLAGTIEAALGISWPVLDLIVVDDGSTDSTQAIAEAFIEKPKREGSDLVGPVAVQDEAWLRIIRHPESRGKAQGVNDALEKARGDLILVLDADGRPDHRVAELMAPHFSRYPRLAAVTGNPRVANTDTVLAWLQAIEFSSTVSVLRRAQAGWGRINTCSGICTMFRREALSELKGFDPRAATEDIMFSWKAQLNGWDIFYEPRALFAMHVPTRLRDLFRQRRRWGRGLGEVLRTFGSTLVRPSSYRMWPVALEALLSIAWCLLLVLAVIYWAVAASVGVPDLGNSPLLDNWGIIIVILSILQISWGVHIDAAEDRGISRMLWVAPLYPLFYWLFNALAGISGSLPGLVRGPGRRVTWEPIRPAGRRDEAAEPAWSQSST